MSSGYNVRLFWLVRTAIIVYVIIAKISTPQVCTRAVFEDVASLWTMGANCERRKAMPSQILNYCCQEHNEVLVAAREKARRAGQPPQSTPEEWQAQDAIESIVLNLKPAARPVGL
jgi:hypothetical protein